MQIGVVYPQTEYPTDAAAVRDFAQAAEALGYGHLLAYDHVLGANPERPGWQGPYTYRDPFHEVFTLFAWLAGQTQRLGFLTGVLILPQRQTALVAKQAASLDLLCGGRLRLGVGIGWNAVEYEALGQDFRTRGRRSAEQVALLKRLWTEELVTFRGRWDRVEDAGIHPLPLQRPIPVWFGGQADAVMERIARLGDGWIPNVRTAAEAAPALEALDRHLEAQGRRRADIGIEPRVLYGDGDPVRWRRQMEEWQAAGATHLSLNTMRSGLHGAAAHLAALERFAEAMR